MKPSCAITKFTPSVGFLRARAAAVSLGSSLHSGCTYKPYNPTTLRAVSSWCHSPGIATVVTREARRCARARWAYRGKERGQLPRAAGAGSCAAGNSARLLSSERHCPLLGAFRDQHRGPVPEECTLQVGGREGGRREPLPLVDAVEVRGAGEARGKGGLAALVALDEAAHVVPEAPVPLAPHVPVGEAAHLAGARRAAVNL